MATKNHSKEVRRPYTPGLGRGDTAPNSPKTWDKPREMGPAHSYHHRQGWGNRILRPTSNREGLDHQFQPAFNRVAPHDSWDPGGNRPDNCWRKERGGVNCEAASCGPHQRRSIVYGEIADGGRGRSGSGDGLARDGGLGTKEKEDGGGSLQTASHGFDRRESGAGGQLVGGKCGDDGTAGGSCNGEYGEESIPQAKASGSRRESAGDSSRAAVVGEERSDKVVAGRRPDAGGRGRGGGKARRRDDSRLGLVGTGSGLKFLIGPRRPGPSKKVDYGLDQKGAGEKRSGAQQGREARPKWADVPLVEPAWPVRPSRRPNQARKPEPQAQNRNRSGRILSKLNRQGQHYFIIKRLDYAGLEPNASALTREGENITWNLRGSGILTVWSLLCGLWLPP